MSEEKKIIYDVSDIDAEAVKKANPNIKLYLLDCTTDDNHLFKGVFVAPAPTSYQKYLVESSDKSVKDGGLRAATSFVIQNILKPTKEEFYELQKKWPFLPIGVANELTKGLGIIQESKKKLL